MQDGAQRASQGARRSAHAAHAARAAASLLPFVALGLSACAGPDATDAADVVNRFAQAITTGDGEAACALLLPDAASALEETAGEPCQRAVVDPAGPFGDTIDHPGDPSAVEVHVAGRQAQVVTGSDTYFLALSGDGWVVSAAACEPRQERPYDCEVES